MIVDMCEVMIGVSIPCVLIRACVKGFILDSFDMYRYWLPVTG